MIFQHCFKVHNLLDAFQKQRCDHGEFVKTLNRLLPPQQFCHRKDSIGTEFLQVFSQLFITAVIKLLCMEMTDAGLQGTDGFQETFFERGTDSHNFSGRFHLCS